MSHTSLPPPLPRPLPRPLNCQVLFNQWHSIKKLLLESIVVLFCSNYTSTTLLHISVIQILSGNTIGKVNDPFTSFQIQRMFGIYLLPDSFLSFHFSDFCPEASYILREIFPSQLIRHFWQWVVTNCLMCMQFKRIKTQVLLCINITIAEIETAVVVTYNSWNCV